MYQGDIRLGDTIDCKFTTVNASGVPTTLAGSPVISAYVGNSTTQITAGITLTVDFDSVTGLNNVRVVATTGNGFAAATNVQMVITTGTVSGNSVVGYVVAVFSIENRGVGAAGITAIRSLASGTSDSGSTTTMVDSARTEADTDYWAGQIIVFTSGNISGQARLITAFNASTDTITFSPATTQAVATQTYEIWTGGRVDLARILGVDVSTSTAQLGVNVPMIDGSTTAASSLRRGVLGNVLGAVSTGSTTTSIVTSSLAPAAAVTDQFKGRILTFKDDTTTANLRGQATDITGSTSGGTLTVSTLTTAPVSGDSFVIT